MQKDLPDAAPEDVEHCELDTLNESFTDHQP